MVYVAAMRGGEKMNENPFVYSKPVKGDKFHNRKEEIEIAIESIKSSQSFSVIGERRIGKTSFLIHILSREVLAENNIDPEKYIIVHFNLSSLHKITEIKFIKAIVERINEKTEIEIESADVFENLEIIVIKLASKDKNLIIALDEFELVAPILDDISSWLRSIFQSSNVVAITASQTTIGEIGPGGDASPLFNIFGNITLGLFSREETEDMIRDMFHKGRQELKEDEVSFLADLSGGNPFLIQLLGFRYYNKKMNKDEFENEMLDQAKDVFRGYWKHLTDEEKEFLLNIETSNNDRVGRNLEKRGFLIGKKGEWRIFSPLFQKFLSIKKEKKEKEIREISEFERIEEKEKKEEKNGKKHFNWIRAVDIFLAFLISIAASLLTPYIQKWLNLSSTFLEGISSKINLISLIVPVLVFVITLFVLMKFHRRNST